MDVLLRLLAGLSAVADGAILTPFGLFPFDVPQTSTFTFSKRLISRS